MGNLKFAEIGCWHVHSERFIMKVNDYPECRMTMLWDPDKKQAEDRAKRLGCIAAGSYEEVLENPEISGVLITSPTKDHFQQIEMALKAGKHVFVEKPPFYTVDEGKEIKRLVEETGLKFLFSDPIRASIRQLYCAREIIRSGRIGTVTTIRTRCAMPMAIGRDHVKAFEKDRTGGGVMFDIGCHAAHMMLILGGKPKRVHAAFSGTSTSALEYGVEDNVVAACEYEDGRLGIIETSGLAERREDYFLISGTEGSICCLDKELRFRSQNGDWVTVNPNSWPQERTYPLYYWIDCIRTGEPVEEDGIDAALDITSMVTGIYEASRQSVEID